MVYKLTSCGLLYLLILVAASSCTSSVTTALPTSTSSSSPRPAASLTSISPTLDQTPLVIPTTTSTTPASSTPMSGCQFVYSIPARIQIEYLIGSLSYFYYKSITLEVNDETSTLHIVPQEGNETVRPITPDVGKYTLSDVLTYLCRLERLPAGEPDQPVHSPIWQMTLKLAGSDEWTIVSTGVVLIEGQVYTDINVSDKEPGILLRELAERSIQ